MAKYHCEVDIKEWDAEYGFDIPLNDFLAELADISSNEVGGVFIRFRKSGDSWDGYSRAEFKVYRHETEEEADAREAREAEAYANRKAEQAARERALFQELKRKYGEGS